MVFRGKSLLAFVLMFACMVRADVVLRSDAGFFIATRDKQKQKKLIQETICIHTDVHGCLHINKRPLACDYVLISPVDGALYHGKNRYTNTVAVSCIEKKLVVVPVGKAQPYKKPQKTLRELNAIKKTPKLNNINQSITIRVLLAQLKQSGMWKLESADGFVVWDPRNPNKKWNVHRDTMLFVRKGKTLYLNGKTFKHDALYVRPQSGHLMFDGRFYEGGFLVRTDAKQSMLINCLDLEKYVFSVLRTESWPGWPIEVNKVFAIASRSYVIAMALRAQKTKKPYHVCNTNVHQTYSGVHNCKIIKRAVEQTKGMFLAYENAPIIAMFDCCCGGVIPAHIADFNFADAPYLAREYACMFCKKCRIYSWKAEYDLHQFEKKLTAHIAPIARLKDVRVTKKDKAGLVKKVAIKSAVKPLNLSGQRLYSLVDEVKSFCFDVRKRGKKVVFQGKGYGHHLGLCQWGAREMVRDGYSYKQILAFYYPGTDFKQLK